MKEYGAQLGKQNRSLIKSDGKTLVDEINEIYAEYGFYFDVLDKCGVH